VTTFEMIIEAVRKAGSLKRGVITHVFLHHDQGCPALKTHRTVDCTCKPDVDVKVMAQD
jgi:hypothetical protein